MTASLILHSAVPASPLALTPAASKGKSSAAQALGNEPSREEGNAGEGGFREALEQHLASQKAQQPLPAVNKGSKPAASVKSGEDKSGSPKANGQAGETQTSEQNGCVPAAGTQQQQPSLSGAPDPAPAADEEKPKNAAPAEAQALPGANLQAVVNGNKAQAAAPEGEPALAARITTTNSSTPVDAAPALGDGKTDGEPGDAHSENSKHEEPEPAAIVVPAQVPQSHALTSTNKIAEADAANATHASDFEAELAKFRSPEPVRGAHVQITGAENQRVDIRMLEQGGTLSLSVRASDQNLTKSLQEHTPELNARLASEHYRAELWTPTAAKGAELRDTPGGDREGANDARGNGGGGEGRQNSSQNKRQRQQPAWLQNFEDQSKTISNRIEYTWHQ